MKKDRNNEFYNYTAGTQPFKGYKQTIIVLLIVSFLMFFVGVGLLVVGLLHKEILYTAFGALCAGICLAVFLLIFFASRLTLSKVELDDNGISTKAFCFKKRTFRWNEILAIDKINVEHNGRGGAALLTMPYIVIQKDNVIKYELTEKGKDVLRDKTNLAIVYTEERYRKIMELWEANKDQTQEKDALNQ